MDRARLDAYFKRIGYDGPREASLAVLSDLQFLHANTIAFENIEALLRRPVPLDLPFLEDKLIARGRGGYCFEQNALFRAVLTSLGFTVTPLLARVQWMLPEDQISPRTHVVLRVKGDGEDYVADVGFGAVTLTGPLCLRTDMEQATPHETFRLVDDGGEIQEQVRLNGQWVRVYRFSLVPPPPVDFEVGNWFVSTNPDSHFGKALMAARIDPKKRHTLRDLTLTMRETDGPVHQQTLTSARELEDALRDVMNIRIGRDDVHAIFEKVAPG